jgi:hypothetical protein
MLTNYTVRLGEISSLSHYMKAIFCEQTEKLFLIKMCNICFDQLDILLIMKTQCRRNFYTLRFNLKSIKIHFNFCCQYYRLVNRNHKTK